MTLLVLWFMVNIGLNLALTPSELQSQLDQAIADKNVDSYTIPPGDYYFINTHFNVLNAQDFEIISTPNKTNFYFNYTYGIWINNCKNFKISNINIDFRPYPCFSQGVIDSVNESMPSIDITVDEGYLLPDKKINACLIDIFELGSTNFFAFQNHSF